MVNKNIDFDDYKDCVLNDKDIYRPINNIRTKNLTNYSITQNKLALCNKDDKRVWFGTTSRAWGHYRNWIYFYIIGIYYNADMFKYKYKFYWFLMSIKKNDCFYISLSLP